MFATTRWSLVAAAGDPTDPAARAALSDLCRDYWFPVYAYVRRRQPDRHAAEDLTQAFFARLLEKNDLAAADPARGRFRTFLLTACQHFLLNQHAAAVAKKRGGGTKPLPLDFAAADGRLDREPDTDDTPEKAFERRWALDLLAQVIGDLQAEYTSNGRGRLFDALKGCLTGGADGGYAAIAAELRLTEGAVKVAAHRLRQRYRDRLRERIAGTVADPAEVDDEIRALFAALG